MSIEFKVSDGYFLVLYLRNFFLFAGCDDEDRKDEKIREKS